MNVYADDILLLKHTHTDSILPCTQHSMVRRGKLRRVFQVFLHKTIVAVIEPIASKYTTDDEKGHKKIKKYYNKLSYNCFINTSTLDVL